MNTENLAPLYLDNQPVTLKDAKPKLAAILSALGKPATTEVKWLRSKSDTQGKSLRAEEVVDRTTEPSTPIYLTSTARGQSGTGMGGKTAEGQSGAGFAGKGGAASGGSGQQFQSHGQGESQGRGNEGGPGQGRGNQAGLRQGRQQEAGIDEGAETDDAEAGGGGNLARKGGAAAPAQGIAGGSEGKQHQPEEKEVAGNPGLGDEDEGAEDVEAGDDGSRKRQHGDE